MSEKKEKKEKEQKNTVEAEPSRRSRKKQNTHKAILHQAKVLFEKEGIGNVTIEQISESADVSRSTFFSHFASVDDLLKEISDEEINDVFEAARKGDGELTVSALLKQLNDDTYPYPYLSAEVLMRHSLKRRVEFRAGRPFSPQGDSDRQELCEHPRGVFVKRAFSSYSRSLLRSYLPEDDKRRELHKPR